MNLFLFKKYEKTFICNDTLQIIVKLVKIATEEDFHLKGHTTDNFIFFIFKLF